MEYFKKLVLSYIYSVTCALISSDNMIDKRKIIFRILVIYTFYCTYKIYSVFLIIFVAYSRKLKKN